ncbi:Uncharacterised protein [Mycobacteroides abscessus subsp. massiliense]|uniref:hypothetical protein n=1 Tax=Mycobacteroides abscessus TaxID=36809 RepID=UPI0009A7A735|nr:hypothetical protein [Mycobacteroides abscessus]SLE83939.1 Uncharacterised protein [Mycobacteroides abscessus subsp. massiliense]
MTTAAIPQAQIGVDVDGLPIHIGVDEFGGTDLCVVAGGPGTGATNMLMLLGSAWVPHLNVVIVGAGIYRAPFDRLAPRQLPDFLAARQHARGSLGRGHADTVLLLDHFLAPELDAGHHGGEPALPLEFECKSVSLDELGPFDPALLDNPGLHVVMRWPHDDTSWMATTGAWNATAAVVIGLAAPTPMWIDECGRCVDTDGQTRAPYVDRRDGRRPREFVPGTYRC